MTHNLLPIAADAPLPTSSDEAKDDQLVAASRAGDLQAFRHIYRQHVTKVRAVLYRLVEPQNTDDLTQEVFIKVWKNLPKLQTAAYLSTWIYRIATNVAYDYYRSRERAVKTAPLLAASELPGDVAPEGDSMKEMIAHALAQLSFDHRTVVVLHDMQELTAAEIAVIIAKPVGTVKSRLSHARAQLKQIFTAWEGDQK